MRYIDQIDFIIQKDFIEYEDSLRNMDLYVEEILQKKRKGLVWFLEYNSIYTSGSGAKDDELLNPIFPVKKTGRGGKYTYHGPGQLVIYLMLDLKEIFYPKQPDLHKYINLLEEWMINSLSEIGIIGERRDKRVGIWVTNHGKEEKICAIGVRVKKWIAYHGLALNLNPNLSHYDGIIPCGIKEFGVTSLAKLGCNYDKNHIITILKNNFNKIF